MSKRKTIVVSVDAMITSDLQVLRSMNELKEIFSSSSQANEMLSVFPALTYPCHVTMMTGCNVDKHGIFNNERFDLSSASPEWYWYSRDHHAPDVFKYARENGLTTASIGWPSTSSNENVDYLISKIWTPEDEDEDKVNSPSVREIYNSHKALIEGHETEKLDEFDLECAVDIISRFKPDITYVYFALIDSMRHKKGVDTSLHVDSLRSVGLKIRALYDAAIAAGMGEDLTFVISSDHGQIDNKAVFNINVELEKRGYIDLNDDGTVKDWRLYAHSAAFTAQIYTKDIPLSEARKVLEGIQRDNPMLLSRILDSFEAEEYYHTSGPFSFVVEGTEGISFGKAATGEKLVEAGNGDYKTAKATHGHSPERGPKPPFVICGSGAKNGAIIRKARLIDEAPTVLALYGIAMPTADGRVLEELIARRNEEE